MNSKKSTKRALLGSVMAMALCLAMLIGTTFAWFTDSASTGVNTVQSGTLDVQLVDENGTEITGPLTWKKATNAPADEVVLWEPGAEYQLNSFKIKNNGNLALKYKIEITGIDGDAKLNEAIDWTYKVDETDFDISEEGHLAAEAKTGLITISGKMKESAGNEYQDKKIDNVSITVVATQYTQEYDSNNNTYDENAAYPVVAGSVEEFTNSLADGKTIVLSQSLNLSDKLSINNDVIIEGNGTAKITGYPVDVGTTNTVTFSGVNFADTTVSDKASSVYGSGFQGTMIFEDCTFGDSNWESVQVTPKGDATIIFKNCTFTATKNMKRFIHVQPDGSNDYKLNITIVDCTFNGCEKVNYSDSDTVSVIDLDYFAKGSTMTLGGCKFYNTDGTEATNAHAYFCQAASGNYEVTYDYDAMYSMLTGDVQTYTVE